MVSQHAHLGLLVAGGLALACGAVARPVAQDAAVGQVTLGIFDSRAVAVAYAHSQRFESPSAALHREYEEAQAAGDEAAMAALESRGQALQEQLHRQGFSTAPVDDLLALIEDELPAIARQAGVDVIVSRWHLVYRDPSAPCVDVTEALVQAFEPSEQGLEWARQVKDHEPVPEDQLDHDH
jgi:hypothetical protein